MRLTEEEYVTLVGKFEGVTDKGKPKKAKYNNKKTWVDGICFDSKKEAMYYMNLKLLMQAGEIVGFCRQPQFILVEGSEEDRAITYKADFIVFNKDGTYEIVDVKGYKSQQWLRTEKHFRLKYPNLKLSISE